MPVQVHCFTGLQALVAHAKDALPTDTDVSVLVTFDHEEVGSSSTHGAGSPIIKEIVDRVNEGFGIFGPSTRGGGEAFKMSLRQSFVMSADVAHAIHPNYAAKHEKNHGPMLNQGTVIKSNSNQVLRSHHSDLCHPWPQGSFSRAVKGLAHSCTRICPPVQSMLTTPRA